MSIARDTVALFIATAFAWLSPIVPAEAAGKGIAIVAGAEVGFGKCFAVTENKAYACAKAFREAANACLFHAAWNPKGQELMIEEDMSTPPAR